MFLRFVFVSSQTQGLRVEQELATLPPPVPVAHEPTWHSDAASHAGSDVAGRFPILSKEVHGDVAAKSWPVISSVFQAKQAPPQMHTIDSLPPAENQMILPGALVRGVSSHPLNQWQFAKSALPAQVQPTGLSRHGHQVVFADYSWQGSPPAGQQSRHPVVISSGHMQDCDLGHSNRPAPASAFSRSYSMHDLSHIRPPFYEVASDSALYGASPITLVGRPRSKDVYALPYQQIPSSGYTHRVPGSVHNLSDINRSDSVPMRTCLPTIGHMTPSEKIYNEQSVEQRQDVEHVGPFSPAVPVKEVSGAQRTGQKDQHFVGTTMHWNHRPLERMSLLSLESEKNSSRRTMWQ